MSIFKVSKIMNRYIIAELNIKMAIFGKILKDQSRAYQSLISPEKYKFEFRSDQDNIRIEGNIIQRTKEKIISETIDKWIFYRKEDSILKTEKIYYKNNNNAEFYYQEPLKKYPLLKFDDYEYINTGFAFSRALLDYNGFCLHSSAVALDNKAVLFSAPCGTGKSTHTGLWRKYFGEDKAIIINDDKPAIRLMGDTFYVYGTPWSGKSDLNTNVKVPLQTIVFLEQASENCIERMSNKDAVRWLYYQSLRPTGPRSEEKTSNLLNLLDKIVCQIPIYKMGCTISEEAVELSYNTTILGK